MVPTLDPTFIQKSCTIWGRCFEVLDEGSSNSAHNWSNLHPTIFYHVGTRFRGVGRRLFEQYQQIDQHSLDIACAMLWRCCLILFGSHSNGPTICRNFLLLCVEWGQFKQLQKESGWWTPVSAHAWFLQKLSRSSNGYNMSQHFQDNICLNGSNMSQHRPTRPNIFSVVYYKVVHRACVHGDRTSFLEGGLP